MPINSKPDLPYTAIYMHSVAAEVNNQPIIHESMHSTYALKVVEKLTSIENRISHRIVTLENLPSTIERCNNIFSSINLLK